MKRLVLVLLALVACTQAHVVKQQQPIVYKSVPGGTARITGKALANDGTALPGVTVTIHSANGIATQVTDVNGRFNFIAIKADTYNVKWELAGYGTTNRAGIVAKDGVTAEVDGRLRVASVSESITVTAETPLIDSRKMSTGMTVSSVDLGNVPTSRDGWTVMQSAPTTAVDSINVGGNVSPQQRQQLQSLAYTGGQETSEAFYAPIVENGYKSAQKEATTTFSIDVDKASYANVRRFLMASQTPPPNAVRIEEMVNYFTYHYAQPNDGRPFAITSEVAGCPWEPKHRLMRIGLQAKNLDQWKLAPNNLVFLLDVSGSMGSTDRLPLIKSALHLLVDQLRPVDSVAIVVYAGAAGVVLPRTPGSDKRTILAALDNLQAGGSTAGGEGIALAYKIARDNFQQNGNNRVILATDGDFNVGISSFDDLTKLIETERTRGIYLTCIGVGNDNLQDGKIEVLADKGNGNYFYLDSLSEAKKVFQQQLQGTLVSVADDVKVQLEFNPNAVASYRQIGYENRALANKDFTDDTKDAGELGSGDSVTVLYEIEPVQPRTLGQIATLKIRYKDPGAATSQEVASAISDDGKGMFDASPDTQFAAAVAEFGMLLRNSTFKGSASWADVAALARAMRGEDFEGYREEFLRMIDSGRTMIGDRQVAEK